MADLGRIWTKTLMTEKKLAAAQSENTDSIGVGRFSRHSFRAKFMLVVGAAVIFDILLSGGISIWNVQRLSKDATEQVSRGLTEATEEYLQTYIKTTALRANLLLEQVFAEVEVLGSTMQTLIDNPDVKSKIGQVVEAHPRLGDKFVYNQEGNWAQNILGRSVVSVWGYLLDENGEPTPETRRQIENSSSFNLIAPSLMASGTPKLQMYYVGPKDRPIMRTTPYTEQAQTFDKLYPGHNEVNFWDFFFPGVYEGWQQWLVDPSSRPVNRNIVATAPYIDAITGKLIVSFFQPLWTENRSDVAGMAAVDVTLDQLTGLVGNVKIADTGFGFLAGSDGNVIATSKKGAQALGLVITDGEGSGVTGMNRFLGKSRHEAVAALKLPTDTRTMINQISVFEDGIEIPYIVVLKQMLPTNLWDGKKIVRENLTLGFVVSKQEIYEALTIVQEQISGATTRIVYWQIAAFFISLIIVFFSVYAISGRITSGLRSLASAARSLQNKDYSVRVDIPTRDEVAAVGMAFNRMAEEISYHTENLENLVEERTSRLETANSEIVALNKKLRNENVRLGAELDIAKQIQEMVLPRPGELEAIDRIEIVGYMEPADEVGGDYYDVLTDGNRIKVGIGDVTGHGLESGVLMLMVQSVARALEEQGDKDPIAFLNVLNRALFKNIQRTNSDKHLTLAFVDYDDGKITISGQHEDVLIIRANGSVEKIDTIDLGFPVGLEADIAAFVTTRNLTFERDDILVLHTDGVTEAENNAGDYFGFDRLCESTHKYRGQSAKKITEGVINDLKKHIGDHKVYDDITLVVLKHR